MTHLAVIASTFLSVISFSNALNSHACLSAKLGSGANMCMPLIKCSSLSEHLTDFKSAPSAKDLMVQLKESVCGFDGQNIMVCCPSGDVENVHFSSMVASQRVEEYPVPEVLHFTSFHKGDASEITTATNNALNLFDTIRSPLAVFSTGTSPFGCGFLRGKINRVVGGTEAEEGAYPWMAALGFRFELKGPISFRCAGALISKRHVLTAAHCIQSGLVLIRLGAHNLSNPLEPNAVDIPIKQVAVHEMFSWESLVNDVAIIELATFAPKSKFIDVICLPESKNFLTQKFVGTNPFLAGWGTTAFRSTSEPILRVVQVPIVERALCENSYRNISRTLKIDEKFICAGSPIADACQGDSGGPLMMPQWDSYTYRYYLFAIVSYGRECTRPGFPGVYTKVASYLSWIRSQLK